MKLKCGKCLKKKIIILLCRCKNSYCSACVSNHDCSFNFKEEFKKNSETLIIDMKEIKSNKISKI